MNLGVSVQILTNISSARPAHCPSHKRFEPSRRLAAMAFRAPQELAHIRRASHLQSLRQPLLRNSRLFPYELCQSHLSRAGMKEKRTGLSRPLVSAHACQLPTAVDPFLPSSSRERSSCEYDAGLSFDRDAGCAARQYRIVRRQSPVRRT